LAENTAAETFVQVPVEIRVRLAGRAQAIGAAVASSAAVA